MSSHFKCLCALVAVIAILKIVTGVPLGNLVQDGDENDSSDYSDDYVDENKPQTEHTVEDMKRFEKHLEEYLDWYYEKFVDPENFTPKPKTDALHQSDGKKVSTAAEEEEEISSNSINDYDQMQGDQPFGNGPPQRFQEFGPLNPFYVNATQIVNSTTKYSEESHNFTDIEYIRTMRDRTKDTWIQALKDNILRQMGRVNSSMPKTGEEIEITNLNISEFIPNLHIPNDSMIDDEYVAEKIRSYYPSCEIPRNTDHDVWKDENTTMNLYFNLDPAPEENGVTIATATLRLYRLPQDNSNVSGNSDSSCENTSGTEDDRLLRISIYWYTKSLKKHRMKRRLSDSKVVGESSKWVELSVRPATRAWIKGRNLGLAVLVEDQDGTVLKADKYFKGASCTVGTSTPKPIPTVIVDAARRANGLERNNGNAGRNTTSTVHNNVSLLPTIDICTLEFPQNVTYNPMSIANLRINACDLKKIHDQTEKLMQKERFEKFAALVGFVPSTRHIRHERQHMQEINIDPRSRMVGKKVILTNEQLLNFNAQFSNNFTSINR